MAQSGERLLQIVDTLLDFSAVESGRLTLNPAPYLLATLADTVVSKWQSRIADKGLYFELENKTDPQLEIVVDSRRLHQVLDELLSNALNFTEHGLIHLSISGTADTMEFAVTDSGAGMTEAQLENGLQAFHQIDGSATRRVGGMGLGLALVRQLVELMGGRLLAESTPGVGSCFRVSVPLA
jgi:signal transduction histidine kinase